MRIALMEFLGDKCIKCGFDDKRALHIGHKNGDGNKDRKRFCSDYGMYKYYLDNRNEAKEKLEITCANCNLIKKFTNKEWCNQYTKKIRYS